MDLEDFRSDLQNRVSIWAEADSNFRHSAFVDVGVELLSDAAEVVDFESCYYRGVSGTRNVGVDGFAFDNADGSIRLFIAAPQFTVSGTLTRADALAQFSKLRAFVEDSIARKRSLLIEENSPARGLSEELAEKAPDLSRVRAYLLTDALYSARLTDWPEGTIGSIPVEFHIWDIARFYRAFTSKTGQDELIVDFEAIVPNGVPCLEASTLDSPYTAYLCVIPGSVLAQIYTMYGSRLLEGNVRSFLSTKAKVNKGIRNTILQEPAMFFAYNNGIAATASAVEVLRNEHGMSLLSATDLQIVNGGQTTASLATNYKGHESAVNSVFVPMKLSVVDPERSVEMIPLISRFANTQNKVSEADFFSTHEYHRRIEQISRRLWAPAKPGAQHETHWFYERARGQYLNASAALTETQRKAFLRENPRDQLITKTDWAKSELSWQQLPHRVSKGAQSAFVDFAEAITKRWDTDRDSVNEEYFRQAVSRLLIFRHTESLVSKQPWYAGGYRANIVTYALAKLASLVSARKSYAIDFRLIWQKQNVSDALSRQLADIAKLVYESITDPGRGQQNVTQWCKREECWVAVQRIECALSNQVIAELVSTSEQAIANREARSQQQMDSGIDAQAAVMVLTPAYWEHVYKWALGRGAISNSDERALRAAAGFFVGSLPTEKQSRRLLEMKAKFEEDGFIPVG